MRGCQQAGEYASRRITIPYPAKSPNPAGCRPGRGQTILKMLVLLLPPHAAFQPSLRLLPLPHAAFAPLSPGRCARQHQMTEDRSGGVEGLSRLQLRRAIAERERAVRRQFRDRTTGGTSDVELEVLETDLDRILQASDLNGDGRIQPTEQQAAFSQWEQIASAKLRELESEPPPVSAWTVAARLLTGEAARSTRAALDEERAVTSGHLGSPRVTSGHLGSPRAGRAPEVARVGRPRGARRPRLCADPAAGTPRRQEAAGRAGRRRESSRRWKGGEPG